MALFPQIATTNNSKEDSATTSHTVSLPASISANDLLMMFFSASLIEASGATPTITTPAGWTLLKTIEGGGNNRTSVFYIVAAGSEGASVAVTTSGATKSAHISYRITDYSGTPQVSTGATGSNSQAPNPDALTASDNTNYLWVAAATTYLQTITDFPSSYTANRIVSTHANNYRTSIAVATKELTSASDNPEEFYATDRASWLAMTIAVASAYPIVTTQAASSVASTTATGNGNITSVGVANCDIRGIVYSTSSHANPGDTDPDVSDYEDKVEESGGSYTAAAFTESLTSLTASTVYYARAYAHNSAGYVYGDEVSFITEHDSNSPVTTITNPTLGGVTVWRNRILYGIDQPNTTYNQNDDVGGIWMTGHAEPNLPLVNSLYFIVSATSAAPYRPWGVRTGGIYADQVQTVKFGYQDTQATATSAQYHIASLDTVYTATDSQYAYYVTLPINCDLDVKKIFHSIRPTMSGKSSSTMGIQIYYRLDVDATSLYDNNNNSTWTLLRTITTNTTNPTTPIRKTGKNIQFKLVFVPASGFSPQLLDYTLVFEPLDQYR